VTESGLQELTRLQPEVSRLIWYSPFLGSVARQAIEWQSFC
jgi:hypothetical protein